MFKIISFTFVIEKISLYFFILFYYQECESSLKHKSELLTKLESQKETMGNAIVQLEKKYVALGFVLLLRANAKFIQHLSLMFEFM